MKSKILKTFSMLHVLVLVLGMCIFTVPMRAEAASLGITPSAEYQSSVYYQRACTAYSSYTDPRTRFVQVALSQAGYKGGTYSGNWAGNGAGGSYTEYGRYMGKDGKDWCASFVSWCAAAAGIPTSVIPQSAGAGYWRTPGTGTYTTLWSNNYTTYNDYKPQVGDLALYMPYCETCGAHYNAQSPTAHVVIVASVSNTQNADGSWSFTTIERGNGNVVSSNSVTTKQTRGVRGTCTCGKQTPSNQYAYVVQGFFRPNWSLMGTTITAGDVYGTLKWTIDSNGVLEITGTGEITSAYTPWRDNLDFRGQIRSIIIGEGITHIGSYTFTNITTATSVTIPSTVKKIGNQAFEGCTGIKSIYLYDGVETIGSSAFWGCSNLSTVNIPDSIVSIGGSAFQNCTSLKSATLPAGAELGDLIYTDCTGLSEITIEDGVTAIGDLMFYNSAITEVTIPASVIKVGANAFGLCENLTDVYLSVTESEWESNVTVASNAFPENVTFHYTYPELDFRIIENENGKVTFGWNYNGAEQYTVSIYDEAEVCVETCYYYPEDAVDGKYEAAVTLEDGNYKVYVSAVYPQVIANVAEIEFEVNTVTYPELDFRITENKNGKVTFGWNYNGGEQYTVSVYQIVDEELNGVGSRDFYSEDAVDGKYETTFTLSEGNYKVYITVVYPQVIAPVADFEFEVKFNDADNYTVENLSGTVKNGKFYAEVDVVNATDREVADTIIIAVYDNDEMIDYVYMKTDLPKGNTVTFGGMLEGVEGATLKAFVWDSIQGMKSLSNVVEK